MRRIKNMLVTGGAGFIGSNFIRYIFENEKFDGRIVNFDKLTYAGNLENLTDIRKKYGDSQYFFVQGDICEFEAVKEILNRQNIDTIVNFAAESHVDRSISSSYEFIKTNIFGTYTLLEAARGEWKHKEGVLFHHISTDEVYGSLAESGYFLENTPYCPGNPYSASKASADHLVMSCHHTYGIPVTISNCSNNYGPYQFPEKLIPLLILNILEEKPLPLYGDGRCVRDWIYVDDHNSAVWRILKDGKTGERYNIGGGNEYENIQLAEKICEKMARLRNKDKNYFKKLITLVKDRPGHDRRYAIDCNKIKSEIGWSPKHDFYSGLDETIEWYLTNETWISHLKSGEYLRWTEAYYK